MTSPFSDELISAYLDGELTAEEQTLVEKQLRGDAELRRMCDELRALRFTLQSLPAADPAEDLADRVLRQAERRMLTGEESVAQSTPTTCTPAVPAISETGPARRHWRLVAGAVASLAALLLLALWLPGQLAEDSRMAGGSRSGDESGPQAAVLDDEATTDLAQLRDELPAEGVLEAESERINLPTTPAQEKRAGEMADAQSPKAPADRPSDSNRQVDRTSLAFKKDVLQKDGDASRVSEGAPRPASGGSPMRTAEPDDVALGQASGGSKQPMAPDAPDRASGGRSGGSLAQGMGTESRQSVRPRPQAGEQSGRVDQQKTDAKQFSAPSSGGPAMAFGGDSSRAAKTEQLISQLNKDQVLLVQVRLPVELWRDSEGSIARRIEKLNLSQSLGEAANWMFDSRHMPEVKLYAAQPMGTDAFGQQAETTFPNLVVVEGSLDEVGTSLTRLVAQPDVDVVVAPTSADQRRVPVPRQASAPAAMR